MQVTHENFEPAGGIFIFNLSTESLDHIHAGRFMQCRVRLRDSIGMTHRASSILPLSTKRGDWIVLLHTNQEPRVKPNNKIYSQTMRTQDALTVRTNTVNASDWVDTVERTATVMKKFFTRTTCRLCQVYADEQVQYEVQLENKQQQPGVNWVSSVRNLEVELYKKYLFDESSVIEHVDSFRDEADEKEEAGALELDTERTEVSASSQEDKEPEKIHDASAESPPPVVA